MNDRALPANLVGRHALLCKNSNGFRRHPELDLESNILSLNEHTIDGCLPLTASCLERAAAHDGRKRRTGARCCGSVNANAPSIPISGAYSLGEMKFELCLQALRKIIETMARPR